MFGPSKETLEGIEAAVARLRAAAGKLEELETPPRPDPDDRSIGSILAAIRGIVGNAAPPPEDGAEAARREAKAVAHLAGDLDDAHLEAFIASSRGGEALELLLRLSPDGRRRRLLEVFPEATPAALDRIAAEPTVSLARLARLRRSLASFRDGSVFRPAAPDLARVRAAMARVTEGGENDAPA